MQAVDRAGRFPLPDGFLFQAQTLADLPCRLMDVGLTSQPIPMNVNGLEDLVPQVAIGGKHRKVISDTYARFVHLVCGVDVLDMPFQSVLRILNDVPPVHHNGLRGFVLGSLTAQQIHKRGSSSWRRRPVATSSS